MNQALEWKTALLGVYAVNEGANYGVWNWSKLHRKAKPPGLGGALGNRPPLIK
ncbi:MAG: hypothetical protein ACRD21_10390 [Vicinamibacteria bacterium]